MVTVDDVPDSLEGAAAATDVHRAVPPLDLRSCARAKDRTPGQPQCAAPPPAAPARSDAQAAPATEAAAHCSQQSLRSAARYDEHAPWPPHIEGMPADRKACQAAAESPPPPDIDVPIKAMRTCGRGERTTSSDSLCALRGSPAASTTWSVSELKRTSTRRSVLASCAQTFRYGCKWVCRALCPCRSASHVSELPGLDGKDISEQPDEECPGDPENGGIHKTPSSDCPKLKPSSRHNGELTRGAPDLENDSAKDCAEGLQPAPLHTPTTPPAVEATMESSIGAQDKPEQESKSSPSPEQPETSHFSSAEPTEGKPAPPEGKPTSPEAPKSSQPAASTGTSAPSEAAISTLERTVDAIMWRLREVTPPAQRKRVFIEQCRAWHPDKNSEDLQRATLAFQRLQSTRVWFLASDEELIAMFGGAGLVNGH